jgi:RNA polymerase sigma factor (sigma-70 family)
VTVHRALEAPTVVEPSAPHPNDLADLFQRYGPELLRYCLRRVGPDHAEDVVAETFLTAYSVRHRYDASRSRSVLPWLYGIATNLLRRHRRAEIRAYRAAARAGTAAAATSDEPDVLAQRAAERVDAGNVRGRLAVVLAGLPRRQRDVLLLHAVAELEYAEIAVALDIPVGTVRSALHRARTKVRAALLVDPRKEN